jgi:hypothetical protein
MQSHRAQLMKNCVFALHSLLCCLLGFLSDLVVAAIHPCMPDSTRWEVFTTPVYSYWPIHVTIKQCCDKQQVLSKCNAAG